MKRKYKSMTFLVDSNFILIYDRRVGDTQQNILSKRKSHQRENVIDEKTSSTIS